MKIVSQDTNRLVLQDSGIGTFIAGIILTVGGLVAAILLFAKRDATNIPFWIGIFPLAFGVLFLVLKRSVRIEMDKGGDSITMTTKKLMGGSSQQATQISNVQKVQLLVDIREEQVSNPGQNSGTHTETVYYDNVQLIFKDGTTIQLVSVRRQNRGMVGMIGTNQAQKIGAAVSEFLGVPFEQLAPPTGRELLQAGAEAVGNLFHKNDAPSVVPTAPAPTPPVHPVAMPVNPATPPVPPTPPAPVAPPLPATPLTPINPTAPVESVASTPTNPIPGVATTPPTQEEPNPPENPPTPPTR